MKEKRKGLYMMIVGGVLLLGIGLFSYFTRESAYLHAARLGGDYLVAHTHTDGSFVYEYNPVTNEESYAYNIVRHAGTTYALLELYEATGEQKYLSAAEYALTYLEKSAVPCPKMPDALCIEEGNETKLGGNALAVLAFSKYISLTTPVNGTHKYLTLAQKLAQFIVNTQAPDGEFIVHKILIDTAEKTAFESEYYPGEALFALARLYEIDKNQKWIAAAHKGAHWLIDVRDANVAIQNLNHDHWLLYALNELYSNRPDEIYFSHAQKIMQSIVAAQHTQKTDGQEDWNGGFYDPPRSTPTATRSEGLGAAYWLFKKAGDEAYAYVALDAMEKAVAFQLRTQFTASELRTLKGDPSGVGGFHESLDGYAVRIDYVQHNVSSLLALDRILTFEKTKSR
jgi:rhamnogalacturonyl hydrolase YesR